MKNLSVFIPILLAILLVLSSITPASAQIIDQSNDVTRGPVANISDFGQSFTPSMKYLFRVDLALASDSGNSKTYDVTINIRESWGGPNLASATTSIPPGVSSSSIGEFVSFIFDPPLSLNPGTSYIIHLPLSQYYHQGGTNDVFHWHTATDGDTYPGGQAFQVGIPRSDDMVFRTFGDQQTPYAVGGISVPVNKIYVIAPYIVLAGLIGVTIVLMTIKYNRKD